MLKNELLMKKSVVVTIWKSKLYSQRINTVKRALAYFTTYSFDHSIIYPIKGPLLPSWAIKYRWLSSPELDIHQHLQLHLSHFRRLIVQWRISFRRRLIPEYLPLRQWRLKTIFAKRTGELRGINGFWDLVIKINLQISWPCRWFKITMTNH